MLGVLKIVCDKDEMVLEGLKEQYKNVETCIALAGMLSRRDTKNVALSLQPRLPIPLPEKSC